MSGALVLDSESLAKAVQRDREIHEWLTAARDADLPVITSAAVLVEVIHPKINDAALKWTLSRLNVEPVTQSVAQSAAALLRAAGLHGHKYAIDAILCATALQHPGRVTILTSDVEDIELLTADHSRVSAEKV
ncbi:PIN domain-containing protein [Streptomyces antibioticus]|uniref:DNA-binding protein n=1 Tax=Streptomyces antibioticus TaxID=1890 RepID=A0AAE6Y9W0_STRAT|nr:PIN domain-containing protein [Streptomyces antibioticus]OOQ50278.1 DNA-binding protein [Streptomyces antibioticus]QIT45700.1 PIN domain-containing protein [Streptomyces antibioticus]